VPAIASACPLADAVQEDLCPRFPGKLSRLQIAVRHGVDLSSIILRPGQSYRTGPRGEPPNRVRSLALALLPFRRKCRLRIVMGKPDAVTEPYGIICSVPDENQGKDTKWSLDQHEQNTPRAHFGLSLVYIARLCHQQSDPRGHRLCPQSKQPPGRGAARLRSSSTRARYGKRVTPS